MICIITMSSTNSLVLSDVISVNTSLANNQRLGLWCNYNVRRHWNVAYHELTSNKFDIFFFQRIVGLFNRSMEFPANWCARKRRWRRSYLLQTNDRCQTKTPILCQCCLLEIVNSSILCNVYLVYQFHIMISMDVTFSTLARESLTRWRCELAGSSWDYILLLTTK